MISDLNHAGPASRPAGSPPPLNALTIGIKGGGDLATGIAHALFQAGFFRLFIMEAAMPTVIRRQVAFASAIYENNITVEGVTAIQAPSVERIPVVWQQGSIPVLPDPGWLALSKQPPDVLVDAVVAKKNLGTRISDAPLVLGLGPGFTAGEDVHQVIETRRGHDLGRRIHNGSAQANTHQPEAVMNITTDRLLRAPAQGTFKATAGIGELVTAGQVLGHVDDVPVTAKISGALRGIIHDGVRVNKERKIGDIDPRGEIVYCHTISDKARALGGAVLGAILGRFNK